MLNAMQMRYEDTSAISLGRYPGFRLLYHRDGWLFLKGIVV